MASVIGCVPNPNRTHRTISAFCEGMTRQATTTLANCNKSIVHYVGVITAKRHIAYIYRD